MENQPSELQFIQSSDLFQGMTEVSLEEIRRSAGIHSAEQGSYLFMEGDPADQVILLTSGSVKLNQITPDAQQVTLEYAVPGETIGVIALIPGSTYPVSAEAIQDCTYLAWDQRALETLSSSHPEITRNALKVMSRHTREFQRQIRDLATKRVARRIARTLTRLARQTGKRTPRGVEIELPLTREDIAQMTGTTLYTVSRTLKAWEDQGLVKSHRGRVIITAPHSLVVIAEDFSNG